MKILIFVGFVVVFLFVLGGFGNVEYVKERAATKWESQGFKIIDYEGFHWGERFSPTLGGGAYVWHRLEKIPNNGITYSGSIQRWGKELHVYGPTAIDAIAP